MLFFSNVKFSNFERFQRIAFIFFEWASLWIATIVSLLYVFWITISLFYNKEFKAYNPVSLKLLLGLFFLNVSNEEMQCPTI